MAFEASCPLSAQGARVVFTEVTHFSSCQAHLPHPDEETRRAPSTVYLFTQGLADGVISRRGHLRDC